jgi:hypothetical protein
MRVILARRAKRGEQRNTAEEEIGEEKIRETFDGFTLPTVSKREGGVHFAGSVILCDPRQKRGKSASTGGSFEANRKGVDGSRIYNHLVRMQRSTNNAAHRRVRSCRCHAASHSV